MHRVRQRGYVDVAEHGSRSDAGPHRIAHGPRRRGFGIIWQSQQGNLVQDALSSAWRSQSWRSSRVLGAAEWHAPPLMVSPGSTPARAKGERSELEDLRRLIAQLLEDTAKLALALFVGQAAGD